MIIDDRDRLASGKTPNKSLNGSKGGECPLMSTNAAFYAGIRNQKFDHEMNIKIESVRCVKRLGVMIAFNLKFSQQYKNAADKTKGMLGFIKQEFLLQ